MQHFNLDLIEKRYSPAIHTKVGDAMSRFFSVTITEGGLPWELPAGAVLTLRFENCESTGWYDTIELPDGTTRAAIVVGGDGVINCEIAKQATAANGYICLQINGDGGYQIASWNIPIHSEHVAGADSEAAQDYYNAFIFAQERAEAAADRAEAAADSAEGEYEKIVNYGNDKFASAVIDEKPIEADTATELYVVPQSTIGVTAHGKTAVNLVDYSKCPNVGATVYGITATFDNGVLTLNGTATANVSFVVSLDRIIAPPFSVNLFNDAPQTSGVADFGYQDENGSWATDLVINRANFSLTVTDKKISLFAIYVNNGKTVNNWHLKPMLTYGTDVPTKFVPFWMHSVESIEITTATSNALSYLNDYQRKWLEDNRSIYADNQDMVVVYLTTHKLLCVFDVKSLFDVYKFSGWQISETAANNNRTTYFNESQIAGMQYIYCLREIPYKSQTLVDHVFPKANCLNKVTIPLYSPLHGIGDKADVYHVNDGKIDRRYALTVLDGTENGWGWSAGYSAFRIYFADAKMDDAVRYSSGWVNDAFLCDQFNAVSVPSGGISVGDVGIYCNPSNAFLLFSDSTTDLAAWKAKLAANPVTIVYELATPTTETVAPVAIKALETMPTVLTMNCDGKVKYNHDTNHALKERDDRITRLETALIALGGAI